MKSVAMILVACSGMLAAASFASAACEVVKDDITGKPHTVCTPDPTPSEPRSCDFIEDPTTGRVKMVCR